ncbi:MAG: hypothetical protein GF344_19655 [Chitinivibrionales bacterium]|nr:hypothetical protein [Chitinivibrionales bacterium]MBD3358837.1 hypothetical protein [Chitinivibrionales bacterium]
MLVSREELFSQAFIDAVVCSVLTKAVSVDDVSTTHGLAPGMVWGWIAEAMLSSDPEKSAMLEESNT